MFPNSDTDTRREILDQIESRFSNLNFFYNKSKFVWLLSTDDHYIYNQLYALLQTKLKLKSHLVRNIVIIVVF
jgi:hypothetical protein